MTRRNRSGAQVVDGLPLADVGRVQLLVVDVHALVGVVDAEGQALADVERERRLELQALARADVGIIDALAEIGVEHQMQVGDGLHLQIGLDRPHGEVPALVTFEDVGWRIKLK